MLICRKAGSLLVPAAALFSLFLLSTSWAGEFAEPSPLAIHSLLLDGAQYQRRMIAVGERGHVLYSDDQGHNWAQARVPTRTLLTGVFMLDETHAWAVGHDATILQSSDGGRQWQLRYRAPDKESPLLDVWFKDQNRGFAIGAYGLFLETSDGGTTWQQRWISETDDFHLNQISSAPDGTLYIAAESGVVYRSDDGGNNWVSLTTPYQGSFFGSLPLTSGQLFVFGLRGHLFRSDNGGDSWTGLATGTTAMLTSALRSSDPQTGGERCLFAGLSGVLLVDQGCNGEALQLIQRPDRSGISALLSSDNDELVLIGEAGITRFKP